MTTRHWWLLIPLAIGALTVSTADTGSARGETAPLGTHSVRGVYHLTFAGVLLPSGTPESGVGIFVADGQGRLTGREVFNAGGRLCRDVTLAATYAVDEAGLGTLTADFTSPTPGCSGSFESSLLVSDGGTVVRSVSTGPDFVTIAEEWRRQAE